MVYVVTPGFGWWVRFEGSQGNSFRPQSKGLLQHGAAGCVWGHCCKISVRHCATDCSLQVTCVNSDCGMTDLMCWPAGKHCGVALRPSTWCCLPWWCVCPFVPPCMPRARLPPPCSMAVGQPLLVTVYAFLWASLCVITLHYRLHLAVASSSNHVCSQPCHALSSQHGGPHGLGVWHKQL